MSQASRTIPALLGLAGALVAAEPATSSGETITVVAQPEPLTAQTTDQAAATMAQVPGGTAVVDSDTIRRGRTSTLRDALQTVPGVLVQPRHGSEEARLSIRGSGIQRTFHLRGIALLQDGQPINQADGSGDFQAIDPGLANHLTVERGGNALRYGAATLGGAINFVSPTGHNAPGTDLRLEGGSFGYFKSQAAGGFTQGDWDGWLAVSQYVSEGYRDHAEQANQRAFGNVGWRPMQELENRVFLSYVRSDSELPGALTQDEFEDDPTQAAASSLLRDAKRDFPLWRVADRAVWQRQDLRLEAGLGWMRKALFHPLGFGLIEQDSDDVTATLRGSTGFGQTDGPFTVRGGLATAWGRTDAATYAYAHPSGHERGALTSEAEQTATNIEAHLELLWRFAPAWTGIVGAQAAQHNREFSDEFLANGDQSDEQDYTGFNPKLGMLWQATDTIQGFTNLSRSFEPPTFAEYVQRDTSGQTRPQQDLEAQTAWTLECGSRGGYGSVRWDVSVYYAQVEDEYLAIQVAPGLTQTLNADTTVHTGLELGLEWDLVQGLADDSDRLVLAPTWTWGRFTFDDDEEWGDNTLPGLPAHSAHLELRYEKAGWHAAVLLDWQSDWYVDFSNDTEADGELLLGLRGGYRTEDGFAFFVQGSNLTDQEYVATSGIANPAAPADSQALCNPGDGLGVVLGVEWRR